MIGQAFQFQTGAIKSPPYPMRKCGYLLFQFQTGAIKRRIRGTSCRQRHLDFNSKLVRLKETEAIQVQTILDHFNSKLVRLKVDGFQLRPAVARFQFQTGAIKSGSPSVIASGDGLFQFQTGAIKSQPIRCIVSHRLRISIPNWCD